MESGTPIKKIMLQKYKNNWETCHLFSPKNILPATFDAFIGFFSSNY